MITTAILAAWCLSASVDDRHAASAVRDILRERARRLTDDEIERASEALYAGAVRESLDPLLILAVVERSKVRSGRSDGAAGALGLMQVMPRTGERLARVAGVTWIDPERTLLDPVANLKIGVADLGRRVRTFSGEIDLALTAYCHGPRRVQEDLQRLGAVDERRLRSSRRVHEAWSRLRREVLLVAGLPAPGDDTPRNGAGLSGSS